MLICFGGMLTITLYGSSNASEEADDDAEQASRSKKEVILGYCIIFVASWVYASNCVLNRGLKTVHHSIVMFWHGMCGLILAALAVFTEAAVKNDEPVRFFHFDQQIYLLMIAGVAFDTLGVNSQTIAFQSDSSGFVALLGYISVVYAYISDTLIFHETFSWIELLAAIIILSVIVGTSVFKICQTKKAK